MARSVIKQRTPLSNDLAWLKQAVETRFRWFFEESNVHDLVEALPPPKVSGSSTDPYARFLENQQLEPPERLVLLLGLAPLLQPGLLDILFTPNTATSRRFAAFGGVADQQQGSFWPTIETALWLLSGDHLPGRVEAMKLFAEDGALATLQLLEDLPNAFDKAPFDRQLNIRRELLYAFTTGNPPGPRLSTEFPARRITTALERDDIVLSEKAWNSVQDVLDWLQQREQLGKLSELSKRLRPGYRTLFYGPPGTGKSMLAAWLGKQSGQDVYRIDLGMVVSKYIGETEKNLTRVFDGAERNNWILFFDEADALFGKRTQVRNSNDRYANQGVSHLLQRIEVYPGLVILATNMKDNIDEAFLRRFDNLTAISLPAAEQREALWRASFSPQLSPAADVDLAEIAERYPLSGGMILNAVQRTTTKALSNKQTEISAEDLIESIRKELAKNKIFVN